MAPNWLSTMTQYLAKDLMVQTCTEDYDKLSCKEGLGGAKNA